MGARSNDFGQSFHFSLGSDGCSPPGEDPGEAGLMGVPWFPSAAASAGVLGHLLSRAIQAPFVLGAEHD